MDSTSVEISNENNISINNNNKLEEGKKVDIKSSTVPDWMITLSDKSEADFLKHVIAEIGIIKSNSYITYGYSKGELESLLILKLEKGTALYDKEFTSIRSIRPLGIYFIKKAWIESHESNLMVYIEYTANQKKIDTKKKTVATKKEVTENKDHPSKKRKLVV